MNSAIEQIESLRIQPGAKPGRIILLVDLSEVEQPSAVLKTLEQMGYLPQIRYIELAVGLHIAAVLKDESFTTEEAYNILLDEWENLAMQLTPNNPNKAVHLWRGLSATQAT